jgi:hypothetical protein
MRSAECREALGRCQPLVLPRGRRAHGDFAEGGAERKTSVGGFRRFPLAAAARLVIEALGK